ncbi:MAG: NAD(P)/FAD-dependent oxidoreductase [Oscillospiraceae bacterium]
MNRKTVVIGGGAAGMMAAYSALNSGDEVYILEQNDRLGKKLMITGKGRCNVTNNCDREEFLNNVPRNPRFLYSAFSNFDCNDTINFFENAGVPLKTERGNRVFPQSDKAIDIVNAMKKMCSGAKIINSKAKKLIIEDNTVKAVMLENNQSIQCDKAILCTGGKSYPLTGSDGSGYSLAQGHTITPIKPSLVPLVADDCEDLQGLSLKNVTLSLYEDNKLIYKELGEMLFTHFGISGPLTLSASSHINNIKNCYALIDFKPALDEATLDKRIQRDFIKYQNKDYCNSLDDLLPRKLIPQIILRSGISGLRKVNSITKEERHIIVNLLKKYKIDINDFRPIDEAIVTSGGICVKEINPKTMESKLINGLYFAGEVIDVDGYTGGFNLQIAFSTGYLAGM